MRLVVLGGTAFLGRAVARAALAAGDDVTCVARGTSGEVPEGACLVHLDRDAPDEYQAIDGQYDAIVDVSSRPSHVRAAVTALAGRVEHWVYVSSASVYADSAEPGQQAASAPTVPPAPLEVDDPRADEHAQYGPCKMACENAVVDTVGPARAFVCRAGLIVGPEDTSDRFTYWPVRLARGGEVLAPGTPADLVQWVDVADLATWLVRAGRERLTGRYDGIGTPITRADFLAGVAAGVGASPASYQLTWVDHEFLQSHDVHPWAGPRSLPLWLPLPEYAGFLSRDPSASLAAGLSCRDLSESAHSTLDWHRTAVRVPATDPARSAGLEPADEAEVLADWHRERG